LSRDKYSYAKDSFFKSVVDFLNTKNIVLCTLNEIDLSMLNTRKKIQIFSGVTEKRYYISIFIVRQKSRFLIKNAKEIVDLKKRLEDFSNHIYRNRLLVITSPLCTKAKSFLKTEGWKIIEARDDTL